ncbi:hypothetical protein H8S17_08150 [Roseburia sp. BX1005]|uniref:DUF4190 domain-containing protein n=1 Tax=Roseburia zhanii TaxID=2763064 RepID=A0A923LPQ7_9FIRM|nr:hypothetical protein [Roseburia zhanii]MBC5714177.1 hypothetical protein [Roseburia zhanii]
MDYQPDGQTPYQNTHSQNMALASLILGTLALLTCGCIYFAVVCASLGIIFALLSKGGSLTMNTSGKIGLVLSSLGLAFTLLLYIGLFLYVLKTYGGFDGFMQESLNFYGVDSIEELYQMMGVPY